MASLGDDTKQVDGIKYIEDEGTSPIGSTLEPTTTSATTRRKREAPELVRMLSSAERQALEKTLVRKIDFRLLPMVVVMVS